MRKRLVGILALWAVPVILVPAAPAGAQSVDDLDLADPAGTTCAALFSAGAFGGFGPAGEVAPGQPFEVDVTWDKGDVPGEEVHVLSCVAVDGKLSGKLSTKASNVTNDGSLTLAVTVPEDTSEGAKICGRAAVISEQGPIRRFRAQCKTVAAGDTSETAAPAFGPSLPGDEPATAEEHAAGATVAGPTEVKGAGPETPSSEAAGEERSAGPEMPTAQAAGDEPAGEEPAGGPPVPRVKGATEERAVETAPALARTGAGRILTALAGALFVFGGGSVVAGAGSQRRRSATV